MLVPLRCNATILALLRCNVHCPFCFGATLQALNSQFMSLPRCKRLHHDPRGHRLNCPYLLALRAVRRRFGHQQSQAFSRLLVVILPAPGSFRR